MGNTLKHSFREGGTPQRRHAAFCVSNDAKTENEIADALGVSPVCVETEVAFLEEYSFPNIKNTA